MTSLDKNLNAGNKRFSFASKAFPADKFSVVKMEGYEAISANFSFELTLVSDDTKIDFETMLSNPATFTLYAAGGNMDTPYHGVLSEFEQLHKVDDLVFYRAVLAPRLQRLNLYRTSDVHLNDKTIPEILAAVVKDSGLTSADFEQKLKGTYRKRSFVCQYQETNLDFITRWMEKEGMYFYFDHSGDAEKLVMVDDTALQPAGVLGVTYRPVENMASGAAKDSVQEFLCRQKPLPKQVILQGFNYNSAAVELKQTAQVSAAGTGDVMLYGENFLTQDEGQRYAKLRAEELLCGGKVFKGEATAVGVRSGYFMQMAAHYRMDFNGKYLVTEVRHKGSQAGVLLAGIENSYGGKPGETDYHLTFKAMPSAVQFRPARAMIRPHVAGTISAIVDAEGSGEYAEMDDLGQYKVQLPFSRTGKAANKGSARIRMATPYSGRDHGMHFPLLKGAEVLLSFVDGDPDQPVIVNTVPNSENLSVVNSKNPSKDIIKTAGGNFLELEDTKSRQHLQLYSPILKSSLRMGAATDPQSPYNIATLEPWKQNYGVLCETQGSMGLNPVGAMVLKAGSDSKFPVAAPGPGDLQALAKSTMIDLDNQRPISQAPTPPGMLEIYARHLNLYAEPTGSADGTSKFQYQLITSNPPAPAPAPGPGPSPAPAPAPAPAPPFAGWSMANLYTLGNLGDLNASLKVLPADGVREIVGTNKTSYTQANSNSVTFGDSASVTRGNSIKLTRGMDTSHTYGMSSSLYFGMKSDMMMGLSNSTYLGVKNDLYLGAKASFAISAELKVALSATQEFVFGSKNGVALSVIEAKTLHAKALAVEQSNAVANMASRVINLTQSVNNLEDTAIDLCNAVLHIYN